MRRQARQRVSGPERGEPHWGQVLGIGGGLDIVHFLEECVHSIEKEREENITGNWEIIFERKGVALQCR